ncbi:helix-turn-helix transcriptional regulator [Anabaena sp. FACHB-709]|uniref:Transcriptional regulator n=2 Tax=Nostocaceae TaxID=1162 RepID=A0A1Z4KFT6_ANAVA|nr:MULTISPECIES: AraC family transcriptional regulator [Nostocaceae]BAY67831.1 transcriptional regulator [Trichormus variabilis NIES-23]HBW29581.1 AraC family transcriptional regulator [Nostoc sp. UBA8866]MBD2170078.1 helix-turn-helix transcriptional regulator [Anabaena cylindrica FACHB-318]MBD2261501.1 helix-turn-helix transcriptional regulator [Anabaena sp. FACHB-709]MBD2271085.1 helix-turn-helix transcriptional regulator [Nostoc sp. PCC 7120 = FACHB-418]
MTFVLQESADCHHLWSTNLVNNCTSFQPKTYEFPINDPKGMSHGYRRWYHLRPGISLLVDDYTLHDDLVIKTSSTQPMKYLELSFSLLGNNYNERVCSGQNFLSCYTDSGQEYLIEWKNQNRILKFDIHIEWSIFKNLITNQIDLLPSPLKDVIKIEDDELDYLHIDMTTPKMQGIIREVLHCPYQGLTKQLYLEGKILELLALRLENFTEKSQQRAAKQLKPYQVDSIYQARDILISNINQPPSLLSLARQVGLNDCILKKGFQEIFGTTAFGYLHKYRMERAKELLREYQMNVNQVAQAVGYESRSSFVRAFSKQFGVSPSAYIPRSSV